MAGSSSGLGFLRLVLAAAVVVSHSWPLGGYGPDPMVGQTNLGRVAVFGFFAISGYLITASSARLGTGRYFWHRVLRVFPGVWVCLLVIALVLAPLTWTIQRGTLRGFDWADAGQFLLLDSALRLIKNTVSGTPTGIPHADSGWDGALWSLAFEFGCYVLVGILVARRWWDLRVVGGLLVCCAVVLTVDSWWPGTIPEVRHEITYLLRPGEVTLGISVLAAFLGGALLHLLRDRLPADGRWAAVSLGAVALGLALLEHPTGLIALPLAHVLIWTGTRVRFSPTGRADLSFGVYIYAVPMAQLLAVLGVPALGHPVHLALTAAAALACATASWFLVERPSLGLRDLRLARPTRHGPRMSESDTPTPDRTVAPVRI